MSELTPKEAVRVALTMQIIEQRREFSRLLPDEDLVANWDAWRWVSVHKVMMLAKGGKRARSEIGNHCDAGLMIGRGTQEGKTVGEISLSDEHLEQMLKPRDGVGKKRQTEAV